MRARAAAAGATAGGAEGPEGAPALFDLVFEAAPGRHAPAASRLWLAGALASGLVLGLGQQVRGAHFMSHTLWAGWLCWSAGWLYDLAFNAAAHRQGAPADDDLAPQA